MVTRRLGYAILDTPKVLNSTFLKNFNKRMFFFVIEEKLKL